MEESLAQLRIANEQYYLLHQLLFDTGRPPNRPERFLIIGQMADLVEQMEYSLDVLRSLAVKEVNEDIK